MIRQYDGSNRREIGLITASRVTIDTQRLMFIDRRVNLTSSAQVQRAGCQSGSVSDQRLLYDVRPSYFLARTAVSEPQATSIGPLDKA